MLQERNARHGFFERQQFESVCAKLPAALKGLATFAYVTGGRTKSEILPLTWANVDRAEGIVRLEPDTTKNREGRQFPYGDVPELKAVMDEQWAAHEALKKAGNICPWVFQCSGKKKQGIPVKNFRRAWLTATKAAGCPGRIPHDFRRAAVRNLVRAGVPEKTAMTITGHRTRSVFDRYHIINEQDQREAVRKLAGTFRGQSADRPRTPQPTLRSKRRDVNELDGAEGQNRTADTVISVGSTEATWASRRPLALFLLAFLIGRGNPRLPLTAADCQPFVSQRHRPELVPQRSDRRRRARVVCPRAWAGGTRAEGLRPRRLKLWHVARHAASKRQARDVELARPDERGVGPRFHVRHGIRHVDHPENTDPGNRLIWARRIRQQIVHGAIDPEVETQFRRRFASQPQDWEMERERAL
jgi:hypothetical protein